MHKFIPIFLDPFDKVLAFNMPTTPSQYVEKLTEKRENIFKEKELYEMRESNKNYIWMTKIQKYMARSIF